MEELISMAEAARRLGKHRHTVAAWVRKGLLPTKTEGASTYIRASVVQGIIEARSQDD